MLNKIIVTLTALFITSAVSAQNGTKSAYSSYGLGIFQSQDATSVRGLAGSGLGLAAGYRPSLGNALSIAGRHRVDFDFGFGFNNRLQQTETAQRTDWAGSVNHFSLAFNTWHRDYDSKRKDSTKTNLKFPVRLNTMVGIAPYTAMDYNYAVRGDTSTFNALLSVGGSGSLNSIYLNNALQIYNTNFTLGHSLQYVFGSITESSLKNILNDSNSIGLQQSKDQRINGLFNNLSLGYTSKIARKDKTTLKQTFAAKYTLGSTLNSKTEIVTRRVEDFFTVKDTLSRDSAIPGTINLPSSLRFGYGLQNSDLWAISIDYQLSNLSQYSNTIDSGQLAPMSRFSAGIILNPGRVSSKKLAWHQRLEWSTGLFYQTGPFEVRSNNAISSINEYGISFGVGLPMRSKFKKYNSLTKEREHTISYLYLSTQYSQRGNTENGLIKEDIFSISAAMNLSDIWFAKRLKD